MPIFRRTNTVCYYIRCTALVLLDVVGSGCGAIRCRMLASYNGILDKRHGNNIKLERIKLGRELEVDTYQVVLEFCGFETW